MHFMYVLTFYYQNSEIFNLGLIDIYFGIHQYFVN